MGDMNRYRNDSSKLTHIHFVGSFSCVCFIVRAGGFSPQASARQMLHPEDRRSSTGDAFLCAAS